MNSRTRRGIEPLALEEPVLTERVEESEQGDQQGDGYVDQGGALAEEIKKLGNRMSRSLEDWQRTFEERIKLHLEHADKKAKVGQPSLRFKSEYNQCQFERVSSYKLYLLDIDYYLSQNNIEDAMSTTHVFLAELNKFMDDLKIADRSSAGYEQDCSVELDQYQEYECQESGQGALAPFV